MSKIRLKSCDVKIHVEFEDKVVSQREFDKACAKFRKDMKKQFGYEEIPANRHKQPEFYFTYEEVEPKT